MKKSKFTEEQILLALRQAETGTAFSDEGHCYPCMSLPQTSFGRPKPL